MNDQLKDLIKVRHSPNFSSRKGIVPDMAIIHYTASMNCAGSLAWFENPESKVSAHFVIDRDGTIFNCVDEVFSAWHAGKSEWDGRKFLNKYSIGIELVGIRDRKFTEAQYDSLILLLRYLVKEYNIPEKYVLGHEHVSPGRKRDSGRYFDYIRVYDAVYREPQPPDLPTDADPAPIEREVPPDDPYIRPGDDHGPIFCTLRKIFKNFFT